MSTHECPVVTVKLEPCPNSDNLAIVRIDGYQVVVRKDDWADGQLGVYIPPDYVVPEHERFAFLDGNYRIKPRRFRGNWSEGLLLPADAGMSAGDDAMAAWGVVRYEPPETGEQSESTGSSGKKAKKPWWKRLYYWLRYGRKYRPLPECTGPKGLLVPVYDVENIKKFTSVFVPGDPVVITEKIHGANARFVFYNGEMHVGSRKQWKRPGSQWHAAIAWAKTVEEACRSRPGLVLFGEIYGHVQDMKYETSPGEVRLAIFDAYCTQERRYLSWAETAPLREIVPWVPVLYIGPFDYDKALSLADGNSSLYKKPHCREGVVIRPVIERYERSLGRAQLKLVSNNYLER